MHCDKQVGKANDNGKIRLACLSLHRVFLWSGSRGKFGRGGEVLWSCLKIAATQLLLTPLPAKSGANPRLVKNVERPLHSNA